MAINIPQFHQIQQEFSSHQVELVAVSKTKPKEDLMELYQLGQRDFGENYVQELLEKQAELPADIRWHFIGHLQSNKVKLIIPFVHLIHGVDSFRLLKEIDKQAKKLGKTVNCLLQIHIAQESTKFGMDEKELGEVMLDLATIPNVRILGLMGMATFSKDQAAVRKEFALLANLFKQYPNFQYLSMGMSSDYQMAIEEGSNMVRIGSLLFGERN